MKKASFYMKHNQFRHVYDQLMIKYDSKTVSSLLETADAERTALLERYKNQPAVKKMHSTQALSYIAVYRVLKNDAPDDALDIVAEQSKANAQERRKTMLTLSKWPHFFVFMTSLVSKLLFGAAGGFVQKRYKTPRGECRFDIEACPYAALCAENGCEELCAIFCQADVYTYGLLPNVAFVRTQTLGTGGTVCDFCYRVKKSR